MSEVIIPKFVPTWDGWGETCCCEAIVSQKQICCNNNLWFLSEYGKIGILAADSQEIVEVGFVESYLIHHCCGDFFLLQTKQGQTYFEPGEIMAWYKNEMIYHGPYFGHICCGNRYLIIVPEYNNAYAYKWWYKNKNFTFRFEPPAICCNDTMIQPSLGTIHFKGNLLDLVPLPHGYNVSCGNDYATYYSADRLQYTLLYKGEAVYSAPIMAGNPLYCNEYCLFIFTGTPLFYKGILVEGTIPALSFNRCCGDYYMLFNNSTYKRQVIYKGEVVFTDSYNSQTGYVCGGDGDYFRITTASDNILFYKGTIVAIGAAISAYSDKCCNDYLIDNSGVWYEGQKSLNDGSVAYRTHDNDYLAVDAQDMTIAWHQGEELYRGSSAFAHCCGDYLIIQPKEPGVDMAKIYYKGDLMYDGRSHGSIPKFVCAGPFLSFNPNATSTIIFLDGEQVEYEQEKNITYASCGSRLYLVNDDETIGIWDADFGKMKFDVSTFDRIA